MRKINIVVLVLAVLVTVNIGCNSFTDDGNWQVVQTVLSATVPLAISVGTPMAQQLVNQMVIDGKLSSTQASAVNVGLNAIQTQWKSRDVIDGNAKINPTACRRSQSPR